MTWCKRAFLSREGNEQPDGSIIGLSYGIEQRDLWSELVTCLWCMIPGLGRDYVASYLLGLCCNNVAPLPGSIYEILSKCPVSIVKRLFSSTKLGFVIIVSFKKGRFGERQVLTVADRLWIWHLRNMRLDECSVIKDDLSMKSINDCDVTLFASARYWCATQDVKVSNDYGAPWQQVCTLNSYSYDSYCCSKYDRLKW